MITTISMILLGLAGIVNSIHLSKLKKRLKEAEEDLSRLEETFLASLRREEARIQWKIEEAEDGLKESDRQLSMLQVEKTELLERSSE